MIGGAVVKASERGRQLGAFEVWGNNIYRKKKSRDLQHHTVVEKGEPCLTGTLHSSQPLVP